MQRWSNRGYFLSHYWCFLGSTHVDIYTGEVESAYARVKGEWPRLVESMLPRSVQLIRIEALHVRARAALALAARGGADQARLCREAERDARKIEKEGTTYGTPLGRLVRAGVLHLRGDGAGAAALLDLAIAGFDATDMSLYAAAARYRRGTLNGDAAEVAAAEAWMREEGIRAPARMVGMFAPGLP